MNNSVGRTPSVFVSSTCYDLSLIRAELHKFIEEQLGYNAVMSEYNSFPVNPVLDPIDNCKKTVRDESDIFILIIGCRLGYVTESGKSITNLEYLNAKARGIPVYIFVDEKISNTLPLWRSNKSGDFSSLVDNTDLFKFVEEIMLGDQRWIFKYKDISSIINTLRTQFGYLLFESIKLRNRIYANPISIRVRELEGEELFVAIEKPPAWEYILFGLIMEKRFKQYRDLRSDLHYGISSNKIIELNDFEEMTKLSVEKANEILTWINSLSVIIDEVLPVAVGEPGCEGDIDKIIYAANKLGDMYGNIIKSTLDFQAIKVSEDYKNLATSIVKAYISPLNDLDEYCNRFKEAITRIREFDINSDDILEINIKIDLNVDLSEFDNELSNLCYKYNIDID